MVYCCFLPNKTIILATYTLPATCSGSAIVFSRNALQCNGLLHLQSLAQEVRLHAMFVRKEAKSLLRPPTGSWLVALLRYGDEDVEVCDDNYGDDDLEGGHPLGLSCIAMPHS